MEDIESIFSYNWSDDELKQMRAAGLDVLADPGAVFTCDSCGLRPKCAFAFDPYCTGDDCLADK